MENESRMRSLTDKNNFFRAEAELILDEVRVHWQDYRIVNDLVCSYKAVPQRRKQKAKRIKDLGSPISLSGTALAMQVQGQFAWVAENTSIIRKVDLEVSSVPYAICRRLPSSEISHLQTGATVQRLRGHTAPATILTFFDSVPGSGDCKILISGSWDKVRLQCWLVPLCLMLTLYYSQ